MGQSMTEDDADEDVDMREPLHSTNGNVNQCSYCRWKSVWGFLKNLKIDLPYGPDRPLPGIYPKDPKASLSQRYLISMIVTVLSEPTEVPKNREMDTDNITHTHSPIVFSHKK